MKTQIKFLSVMIIMVLLCTNLYSVQNEGKYIEPSVNISYLVSSFDKTSKSQSNFWGLVAKLFNLNLDKERQAYTNQSLSDISFEVTLNENIHDYHSKNITITAQKTIFQW